MSRIYLCRRKKKAANETLTALFLSVRWDWTFQCGWKREREWKASRDCGRTNETRRRSEKLEESERVANEKLQEVVSWGKEGKLWQSFHLFSLRDEQCDEDGVVILRILDVVLISLCTIWLSNDIYYNSPFHNTCSDQCQILKLACLEEQETSSILQQIQEQERCWMFCVFEIFSFPLILLVSGMMESCLADW